MNSIQIFEKALNIKLSDEQKIILVLKKVITDKNNEKEFKR